MLSCGALERSNNPYMCWNFFLRIGKTSSLCEFDWEENPEKGLKQSKRVSTSLSWNLCICMWETKKLTDLKLL